MTHARTRAAALFAQGLSRAEVARRLGVARSTAGAWFATWRSRGTIDAASRGRRRRLSDAAAARLARALLRPPRACGFDLDRWSLAAISAHLARGGVAYHPRHVTRLLRSVGWVVPPVGTTAHAALYARTLRDPDGNVLRLLARAT